MAGELTRRDFMRALVLGAGALALPAVLVEESRRRKLEQPLTLSRSSWVPGQWKPMQDRAAYVNEAETLRRIGSSDLTFNPPDAGALYFDHQAYDLAIARICSAPWHCVWITGITADVASLPDVEGGV